jgi:hypothetical protein
MPSLDGELRDGRHHMQIRVYYEDTDFSGLPAFCYSTKKSSARRSGLVYIASGRRTS